VTFDLGLRGARRALVSITAVALLVAACGGTATPTPAPSRPPATPSASDGVPTGEPTVEPTDEPTPPGEPTPEPTLDPTDEPTDEPSEEPSPPGGTADECTGSDDNRAFYVGVADAVTWDVYCPVLPAGWFVDAGDFRLSGGGRMDIAYKGPGGRRIEIRQGTYCAGDTGCIPAGPDAGTASYGGRAARLVDVGGGAWLVVAEGGDVNWEARGTGMDGPTLAGLTADFVRVGE
jgi:hypothetical protein